jgi:hypothetical protein
MDPTPYESDETSCLRSEEWCDEVKRRDSAKRKNTAAESDEAKSLNVNAGKRLRVFFLSRSFAIFRDLRK